MPQKQVLHNNDTDHVLHGAQVLGALAVAVVLCQVCPRETILVFDAQVHAVHHEDLTALECQTNSKQKKSALVCVRPGGKNLDQLRDLSLVLR